MTWKKRIISIALCLCALLCAASVRAEAADEHSHPICGANHTDVGNHTSDTCSSQTWTAWDGTDTIGNDFFKDSNTKYLYLSRDVEMSDKWTDTIVPEGKTLYLCLNGHSLTRKASGYTINVYGTLVLCDCNGSRQGKGVISHGKKDDGSLYGTEGIYVIDNAVFKMYGGKISGNNGGVIVSGGTFTMYGGEISHNTRTTSSAEGGGGVWVKDYKSWSSGQTTLGNFAMYGGTICNNEIQSSVFGGGGVGMDSDGSFYMENGTITGNKCNNSGGGLDIRCTTITIKGNSTISGNTCGGEGGGIFAISSGESSITNCTISGNNATGTNSKGGGLAFQNSTFTLEKCTIIDNKTTGKGGAICLMTDNAYVTLSSGLNFSGNQDNCPADKSGNLTTGTANDVFLHTGAYLRLASDFSKTSTAPIVVTTYFTPSDNSYQKIAVDNRTTPDPTDFKYGTDSTIGIIAKTNNGKVELLACKHSYSTQKDETNHWQECSICKDIKGVTAHSGGEASCTKKAVCRVCNQPYGKLAAHVYDMTTWVKIDNDHHGHKCKNCNAIDESTKAPHTWDEGKVTTPATCTAAGVKTLTCAVCSATKTETIPATGHAWDTEWSKDNDHHWHKCKNANCTEIADQAEHSWDEGTVTTPATCTADGVKTLTCTVCSATKKETIPATGHAWDTEWSKDNDHHWHKCKNANCTEIADQAEHSWDEGTVTTPATCTADGVKTLTCTVCSATKKETIPATGHAWDTEWSKDNDHHWHKCKNANCDAVKDKAEHDWNDGEVTTPATCTTVGEKTYTCTACSATKTETIGASGHTWGTDWVKDDSDKDHHWHECTKCHEKKDLTEHDWDEGTVTTPATCTTPGERTYTCGTCNATKTETIDASGHTWGTDWVKDDSDKDHHWHECTKCHEKKDLTEHDWDEGTVTTPETCTTPGERTFTCAVCSATKKETIPATGHTPGAAVCENKVAATCTTAGSYDEVVYCTTCGNEVSRTQKTIDKLAHDYDTTKWVKADENQHGHKCKNCDAITDLTAHVPGAAATETTPQLCTECGYVIAPATHPTHTWVFVAETPATCNAAGEREHYKCTCGRTSFKNGDAYDINEDASVLTIEKNSANHTGAPDSKWHSDSANHWQEYTCCHARANEAAHSGGAATCTAQAVCEVCGKAYGPLAAHDWGAWKVTTPATKDAPGVETRTCAHNSAHTETRSIPKLSTTVYTVSEDTKIAQIEAKVDGLDKILELNENKALVNDGKSVGVSLTVKNTASSGVSEKIKEKLAGSNLVGLRLELTVEKTVTANGVVESKQTIPDAGVLLKTTITLPAELQGKSGYVVYRLHDENVHVLTETPNENGEFITVSADKTQITICARLYSEYVIAYQTGGSSGGGYHPVNPTPVKATSANTGDAGVLLYGVTAALSLTGTAWLGAKSRKH